MLQSIKNLSKPAKVALTAILLNLILTILKFILAGITGSLALIAEAYHSFSDIWSSIMVFISIQLGKDHDEKANHGFLKGLWLHPQRMAALFIGIFLLFVSISIFSNVFKPDTWDIKYPVPVGLVVLIFALGSWLLARFEMVVGEKTGSTALVADAYHSRVDMAGSILVAITLICEGFGLRLDRIGAGILAFFILVQAISVFATVIRDYLHKDLKESTLVPLWVENFFKKHLPVISNSFYTRLAGIFKIDPKDTARNSRVNLKMAHCLIILIVIIWLSSCLFAVNAYQEAVVERFGKPVQQSDTLKPGLQLKLPYPVDRIRRVDCHRVKRMVIGSEISSETDMVLWTNPHYIREYNLLTGENIYVDVGMIVQYRISNLYDYLYKTSKPERILEETCYSILMESISRRVLFDSITYERDDWESELLNEIKADLESLETGLEIIDLNLRDIHPPKDIAGDFEDVVSAEIDYETFINVANGYSNDLLPRAEGSAITEIANAKAKKDEMIKSSQGETDRFLANHDEYKSSRAVFKTRLLLETIEKYLPGIEKYILPAESAHDSVELWLFDEKRSE